MSLTVLIIVDNQDLSRDFYHNVMGAEIVRDRDPVILRFHNSVIVSNVGGGPTDDKPTMTMAPPLTRTLSASPSTSARPTSARFTHLALAGRAVPHDPPGRSAPIQSHRQRDTWPCRFDLAASERPTARTKDRAFLIGGCGADRAIEV